MLSTDPTQFPDENPFITADGWPTPADFEAWALTDSFGDVVHLDPPLVELHDGVAGAPDDVSAADSSDASDANPFPLAQILLLLGGGILSIALVTVIIVLIATRSSRKKRKAAAQQVPAMHHGYPPPPYGQHPPYPQGHHPAQQVPAPPPQQHMPAPPQHLPPPGGHGSQ